MVLTSLEKELPIKIDWQQSGPTIHLAGAKTWARRQYIL
jgi:hypothetical protein